MLAPQDVPCDCSRVRPTPTNPEKSYRDGMRGGRAYCGTIKNKVGHSHAFQSAVSTSSVLRPPQADGILMGSRAEE